MKIKPFKIILLALIIILIFSGAVFCFFKKRQNENTLNFVHISDTHIENNKKRAFDAVEYSIEILKDAVLQINGLKNLDMVIFGGDLINNKSYKNVKAFYELANSLKFPYINTFGNHDFYGSDKEEMLDITKKNNKNYKFSDTYYAFNLKRNYRIIVLDTVIKNNKTANGFLDSKQIDFLRRELDLNKNKTIIIVLHHPIIPPYEAQNHILFNAHEVNEIISKYNNPIIVLQGRYLASKITAIKNILYVSTPAMVTYPMAFRHIKATNYKNKINFDFNLLETGLYDIKKEYCPFCFNNHIYIYIMCIIRRNTKKKRV